MGKCPPSQPIFLKPGHKGPWMLGLKRLFEAPGQELSREKEEA